MDWSAGSTATGAVHASKPANLVRATGPVKPPNPPPAEPVSRRAQPAVALANAEAVSLPGEFEDS